MKNSGSKVRIDEAIGVVHRAVAANAELPALDERQLRKLKIYLETLLLWRRRMALIATSDPVELVENHILDSLHVAPHLRGRTRVADIGSGAGLPGIPLAIAVPGLEIELVESRRKKANFLRTVRRQAELPNVHVFEGRAEDLSGVFEVAISRAFGKLSPFLDLAEALLPPGGLAIAMKAPTSLPMPELHPAFEFSRAVTYDLARGRRRLLLLYARRAGAEG